MPSHGIITTSWLEWINYMYIEWENSHLGNTLPRPSYHVHVHVTLCIVGTNYQKIARQCERQKPMKYHYLPECSSFSEGLQHLQSIVYWSLPLHIWFSGISAMYNKKLNLKSLSSISGNMKWCVTSILWRQGVSWSKVSPVRQSYQS